MWQKKSTLLAKFSQEVFQELWKNLLDVCEAVQDHVTYEKQPVTLELIKLVAVSLPKNSWKKW